MNQAGLERLLRAMNLLAGKTYYSVSDVARRVHTTPRTVYRYIDTLKSAGFVITKRSKTLYQIVRYPDKLDDLSNCVNFTEEEACILERLIRCLDDSNDLKGNLLQKLAAVYKIADMAHFTVRKGIAYNIDQLKRAIREKRVVRLMHYASAAAKVRQDYLVEPFEFDTNYVNVTAYDIASSKNKMFKVARIEEVQVLDEAWSSEKLHVHQEADAFRMAGPEGYHVRLKLSLRARSLMVEEYPLSEPSIYESDGAFFFDGYVRKVEGIGRFVTGLIPEIEILEGDFLREYVHARCVLGAAKTAGPASPEGQG